MTMIMMMIIMITMMIMRMIVITMMIMRIIVINVKLKYVKGGSPIIALSYKHDDDDHDDDHDDHEDDHDEHDDHGDECEVEVCETRSTIYSSKAKCLMMMTMMIINVKLKYVKIKRSTNHRSQLKAG